MKVIFWLSLFVILYTYAGYPILLFLWSKLSTKRVNKGELNPLPLVSILIAARNEESNIGKRLENIANSNYPLEKMEIVVVSDGSTDGTANIVKEYVDCEGETASTIDRSKVIVKLLELPESRGKASALNEGYKIARGDFIVFTDSRQEFEQDTIRNLLSNFHDESVGCVSGELVFFRDTGSKIEKEMGFYWNLEKKIRKMESDTGSVVGATGAVYAVRRELYPQLPDGLILDDVYVPMKIVCKGYRTVFEGAAIAYDKISEDFTKEKSRKVRTLFGNYQLLSYMPELLSPTKNPVFMRYFSHKILRLLVPFFFVAFFVSSFIADGFIYIATFFMIGLAMILPVFEKAISGVPILSVISKLSKTFMHLNYFAVLAFLLLFRSKNEKVW